MNINLQCVLLLLPCFIFCSYEAKVITRLDRVEVCDQSANSPVTINYIHFTNPVNDDVRLSSKGSITNYTGNIELECNIQRCASQEALDTCIPFTKLKPMNTCQLLLMKNMAWTKIIETTKPPFTCPVTRDAEVIVDDAAFDSNLFVFFPLANAYWKTRATLYFGKEYFTVCVEGRVIPKQKHN